MPLTPALTVTIVDEDHRSAHLAVSGEIDIASAGRLRSALQECSGAGGRDVVVDLSGVSFIDAAGLGVLIGFLRRQRQLGATLTLRGVSRGVRRVFEVTALDRLFDLERAAAA